MFVKYMLLVFNMGKQCQDWKNQRMDTQSYDECQSFPITTFYY